MAEQELISQDYSAGITKEYFRFEHFVESTFTNLLREYFNIDERCDDVGIKWYGEEDDRNTVIVYGAPNFQVSRFLPQVYIENITGSNLGLDFNKFVSFHEDDNGDRWVTYSGANKFSVSIVCATLVPADTELLFDLVDRFLEFYGMQALASNRIYPNTPANYINFGNIRSGKQLYEGRSIIEQPINSNWLGFWTISELIRNKLYYNVKFRPSVVWT